jgi:S-DNA-T family DNA segregation ATPase FtsK/SpoIIIE
MSQAETNNASRFQHSLKIGVRNGVFIFLVTLCLFLILSLASYNPADPGFNTTGTHQHVTNVAGSMGAWIASILYFFFGVTSWILPLMCANEVWKAFREYSVNHGFEWALFAFRFAGFLLVLACSASLLTLYSLAGLSSDAGGVLGVSISHLLLPSLNFIGSTLLLISGFLFGITILTGLSWIKVMDKTGEFTIKFLNFIKIRLSRSLHARNTRKSQKIQDKLLENEGFETNSDVIKTNNDSSLSTPKINRTQPSSTVEHYNQTIEVTKDRTIHLRIKAGIKSFISRSFGLFRLNKKISSDFNQKIEDSSDVLSEDLPLLQPSERIEPTISFDQVHQDQLSKMSGSHKLTDNLTTKNHPSSESKFEVTAQRTVSGQTGQTTQSPSIKSSETDFHDSQLSAFSPVKIEPFVKHSTESLRAKREKQGKLFEVGGSPLPPITLLDPVDTSPKQGYSEETLTIMSRLLEDKLADFGVSAKVVEVNPGPVITRFEIQPAAGVKVSKISNLVKDLARSMAVISVRVVEIIPGKSVVGIEIPNEHRDIVHFIEALSSKEYDESESPLTLGLGNDIAGNPVVVNLAKMPHLLVAGTTGSGKSVGVNSMILSMLFKATPEQVRFIFIDPKMLELSIYEGIPHLLAPVVTDMKEAANSLRWCVAEMERRYRLMASLGVRNLAGYNRKLQEAITAGQPIKDPLWKPEEHLLNEEQERPDLHTLPFIVVFIDEFADMMMIVGKKVEELIARIAQKARAAGIHLVLATQRPSVDVITGLIKANVPTRISFQVSSKIDSRTVLDQGGAEQLLGQGDMLYLPPGSGMPVRVHGAFVSDDEVHRVVAHWKKQGRPDYVEDILTGGDSTDPMVMAITGESNDSEQDALYDQAVAFVLETRKSSISAVQRKLKIGYNRSANLIEAMEAAGILSAPEHNGTREILIPSRET